MDWKRGFSASYYMTTVNVHTWNDIQRLEVTEGSVKRESTGLRESAEVSCREYKGGVEQWVRIYLDAKQGGDSAHVPLFTGIATSPEGNYVGSVRTDKVTCYSVLKPADDVLLQRGWYAPAGARCGDVIRQLLESTPAPVDIEPGSPAITKSIVAEDEETCLSMTEKILDACGWVLTITGNGHVHIGPETNEVAAVLDPEENDIVEMEVSISKDLYACPNCFMAIDDDMTATARDDSPDSQYSTVSRGREVWASETSCKLSDNESIEQYAVRRLKEMQLIKQSASYNRRYVPGVSPKGLVRLRYPAQEMNGLYRVESQNIDLGLGARTAENVVEVIR